ncbi:MAG: hypothetical protein ABIO55_06710 [Ginsengibacter sp.]
MHRLLPKQNWPNGFIFHSVKLLRLSAKESFNKNNYTDEKWIKSIDSLHEGSKNFSDTNEISIRVSSKKVMTGFINQQMNDEKGAFNKLVEILDDFKNTPHNPSVIKNYLFFDGSKKGVIVKTTSQNEDLFKPENYTASENNLHQQFKSIAKEIVTSTNKNKFV